MSRSSSSTGPPLPRATTMTSRPAPTTRTRSTPSTTSITRMSALPFILTSPLDGISPPRARPAGRSVHTIPLAQPRARPAGAARSNRRRAAWAGYCGPARK
ncbi:MAG: hypothetical protein AMK73_06635 [Planctomycetes bacterium SM23_32]|nr:MAG: hypothetical protein AMK73_06635 [Planctomycetes bacterium SM23_32]